MLPGDEWRPVGWAEDAAGVVLRVGGDALGACLASPFACGGRARPLLGFLKARRGEARLALQED